MKEGKTIARIFSSAALLAAAFLLPTGALQFALFLVCYAIIGWDVLYKAARSIAKGQMFNEKFLMSIATLGAFAIGEYPEGVAVMLFYQVGELFERLSVGRSRRSIAKLMDIRPDYANIMVDGTLKQVSPDTVLVGDTIVIKPGERIPLDGVVAQGASSVNTSALTGESMPQEKTAGDEVVSGCTNIDGVLTIQVTKPFDQSTVSKILDLVENAGSKKAQTEQFITRFARYYTPFVVLGAVLLAIVPPLFGGAWSEWIHRALIFLVISCPCALVLSVPLSFFGGIGGASKRGILIKGGSYLEALCQAEVVAFDKTGTLTKGTFEVSDIHPKRCSKDELLEFAALAESDSSHPIALSLKEAYQKEIDRSRISNVKQLPGQGICATIDKKRVCVGNESLMKQAGAIAKPCHLPGTAIYVAVDGVYEGHIVVSDETKADAMETMYRLRRLGISKTVMLTGDVESVAQDVAKQLDIDEVHAKLLPAEKLERVEQLMRQTSKQGKVVFVGDGINDAPVLSRVDVGIAMGALGSDAAIEAADIVLMDDKPTQIATAIEIAHKTVRIAKQNVAFSIGIKALVLMFGALGLASMWAAVFADVGVSVLTVLNASRTLRGH